MKTLKTAISGCILLLMMAFTLKSSACTSFMLKTNNGLYFVHSLNQGDWKSVPGLIFINQRNTWKKGYSWEVLLNVHDTSEPSLVWKSKFGSVTFNPLGKEFPDGGMNEKGLYIWEMSFSETKFPDDPNKPKLFMMQWMQYQLDNFSTIEEVMENAGQMSLDGWEWHFFVADRSGKTAIIDFMDGRPVIYSGEIMPVPICCNSKYPDAMNWLKRHKGFGGDLEIVKNFKEIPRFVYGAKLMRDYDSQDPIDYSFTILDEMSKNVRWSVVFDVKRDKVYFKTNLNQNIRTFAFSSADFGHRDGTLMLDIECPGPENIRSEFIPYKQETDEQLIKSILEVFCKDPDMRKKLMDDQGVDLDGLAENVIRKIQFSEKEQRPTVEGEWTGTVKYPSSDGMTEMLITLVIDGKNDGLSGTVNDDVVIKNCPMTSIIHKGGLLSFIVHVQESGDALYYQASVSTHEIKGFIDIFGERRKATLHLHRKI